MDTTNITVCAVCQCEIHSAVLHYTRTREVPSQTHTDGEGTPLIVTEHICTGCDNADRWIICRECGATIPAADAVDDEYCSNCIVKCCDCHDNVVISQATEYGSQYLCGTCADDYSTCEHCGKLVHSDDVHYGSDDCPYCEHCFDQLWFVCDQCNRTYPQEESNTDPRGHDLCNECFHETCEICATCGEVIWSEDATFDEHTSEVYCQVCYDAHHETAIHDYGYKPTPEYHRAIGERPSTVCLYYGWELEVENEGQRDLDETAELCTSDYTYCKHDGSIKSGFEIVSHPASWQWLNDNADRICALQRKLRIRGFRSYDTSTCGFHVHLSKAAFTTLQTYKLLRFFYDNPAFILAISQRKRDNLQRWASVEPDEQDDTIYYKAKHKNGNRSRYAAVNLHNTHTIEIRIFRGTLNPASLWKNLEFCAAIYAYTREAPIGAMTEKKFLKWIDGKQEYQHLIAFLVDKGRLTSGALRPAVNHESDRLEEPCVS